MNPFEMSQKSLSKIVQYLNAVLFFAVALATLELKARPEFAIRYGINRCTTCHFSPAGGGARNINGKYFGAFGKPANPKNWLQQQDFVGLEAKLLYYRPETPKTVKGGLGSMAGTFWASLPVQALSEDDAEIRLVAEQNMGGFGAGARQWYIRWNFDVDTETSWLPQYVLLGRLTPAFGAMTDEHRTYVRMQSNTLWNTSFDSGVMFSANPTDSLHYDLTIANGRKNSGTATQPDTADVWGGSLNLRWMPSFLPGAFGVSHSFYPSDTTKPEAIASAGYLIMSFHRMTNNLLPFSLTAEVTEAKGWNYVLNTPFINDTNYAATVANSKSRGYYTLVEWELSQRILFQYKYDHLTLDENFPEDAYDRHGAGIKTYFGNNFWGILRVEKASAGHPSEENGTKGGAQDAVWAMLSILI